LLDLLRSLREEGGIVAIISRLWSVASTTNPTAGDRQDPRESDGNPLIDNCWWVGKRQEVDRRLYLAVVHIGPIVFMFYVPFRFIPRVHITKFIPYGPHVEFPRILSRSIFNRTRCLRTKGHTFLNLSFICLGTYGSNGVR
jgi:hypothetical protein